MNLAIFRREFDKLVSRTERIDYLQIVHKYYVYTLECHDETYYTGITSDIENRLIEHQTCKYPKSYTASRQPVVLKYYTEFNFVLDAIDAEKQIKKWSKQKKEALINGEYEALPNLAKKIF